MVETREVVNALDGGKLPTGVADELIGEYGASAMDDLRTPVPRGAERQFEWLEMIRF